MKFFGRGSRLPGCWASLAERSPLRRLEREGFAFTYPRFPEALADCFTQAVE
jgi:hypothetical protein